MDGAPASSFLNSGATAYFVYQQLLPYAVQLTLTSVSGDADLFVGASPPQVGGAPFAYNASSQNGDQLIDQINCLPVGPAWSASGDVGTSCFGPLVSTPWYVQVLSWSGGTFSLQAASLITVPALVGSPQPSPGALSDSPQLALGVTAAGRLDVAQTSAYWEIGVPPAGAPHGIQISLHITGPAQSSDADLLVGTTPPTGPGNVQFSPSWESSHSGDDAVTVPPQGAGSTPLLLYVAVKAFAAPVTYTLLATAVSPTDSAPCAGCNKPTSALNVGVICAIAISTTCFVGLVCYCCFKRRGCGKQSAATTRDPARGVATAARVECSSDYVLPVQQNPYYQQSQYAPYPPQVTTPVPPYVYGSALGMTTVPDVRYVNGVTVVANGAAPTGTRPLRSGDPTAVPSSTETSRGRFPIPPSTASSNGRTPAVQPARRKPLRGDGEARDSIEDDPR